MYYVVENPEVEMYDVVRKADNVCVFSSECDDECYEWIEQAEAA